MVKCTDPPTHDLAVHATGVGRLPFVYIPNSTRTLEFRICPSYWASCRSLQRFVFPILLKGASLHAVVDTGPAVYLGLNQATKLCVCKLGIGISFDNFFAQPLERTSRYFDRLDPYPEFGHGARRSGQRTVAAVPVRLSFV